MKTAQALDGEVVSGGAGFGPRSPLNELEFEMADREAQWVGRIAQTAVHHGLFDRGEIDLSGFWFVNGICKGMRADVPEGTNSIRKISEVCRQLALKAEFLESIGTVLILYEARVTRNVSLKMFPAERDYLSLSEAAKLANREERAVKEWAKAGAIKYFGDLSSPTLLRGDIEGVVRAISDKRIEGAKNMNQKRGKPV